MNVETMKWAKELSATDAQRPTKGAKVKYLRLTKGKIKDVDTSRWFRDKFFKDQQWELDDKNREQCIVNMNVEFNGIALGRKIKFVVNHSEGRCQSHSAPNTFIGWPQEMEALLVANNMTGREVMITKDLEGNFSMKIG